MTEAAHNTYMTYLMNCASGATFSKLIDIKEFPDLGSAPPTLDTTTLSDRMHTYINDILDTGGGLEFTCNYTLEGYQSLQSHVGKNEKYALWFGGTETNGVVTPSGQFGKFEFEGELSCWKKGAGVGAVQEMGISIAPSTEITLATGK